MTETAITFIVNVAVGYGLITAFLMALGCTMAICESTTRNPAITFNKAAFLSVVWPLALAVCAWRGGVEFFHEQRERRRIEEAKRRARVEREFQRALEEIEND